MQKKKNDSTGANEITKSWLVFWIWVGPVACLGRLESSWWLPPFFYFLSFHHNQSSIYIYIFKIIYIHAHLGAAKAHGITGANCVHIQSHWSRQSIHKITEIQSQINKSGKQGTQAVSAVVVAVVVAPHCSFDAAHHCLSCSLAPRIAPPSHHRKVSERSWCNMSTTLKLETGPNQPYLEPNTCLV